MKNTIPTGKKKSRAVFPSHRSKKKADFAAIARAHSRLRFIEFFLTTAQALALILIITENSLFYESGYQTSELLTFMRSMTTVLCCLSLPLLCQRYVTLSRLYRLGAPGTNIQLRRRLLFVLEFVTVAIHIPPTFHASWELPQIHFWATYTFDDILTLLSLAKLAIILRHWVLDQDNEIFKALLGTNSRVKAMKFRFRSYFVSNPIVSMLLACVFVATLSSYIYFLSERADRDERNQGKINSVFDAFWVLSMTALMTGYGDFFPATIIGRIIAILAFFFGATLVSIMIVLLVKKLTFSTEEAFAYHWCGIQHQVEQTEYYAKQVIALSLSLFIINWRAKRIHSGKSVSTQETPKNAQKTYTFRIKQPEVKRNAVKLNDRAILDILDLQKKEVYLRSLRMNIRLMKKHRHAALVEPDQASVDYDFAKSTTILCNFGLKESYFLAFKLTGPRVHKKVDELVRRDLVIEQLAHDLNKVIAVSLNQAKLARPQFPTKIEPTSTPTALSPMQSTESLPKPSDTQTVFRLSPYLRKPAISKRYQSPDKVLVKPPPKQKTVVKRKAADIFIPDIPPRPPTKPKPPPLIISDNKTQIPFNRRDSPPSLPEDTDTTNKSYSPFENQRRVDSPPILPADASYSLTEIKTDERESKESAVDLDKTAHIWKRDRFRSSSEIPNLKSGSFNSTFLTGLPTQETKPKNKPSITRITPIRVSPKPKPVPVVQNLEPTSNLDSPKQKLKVQKFDGFDIFNVMLSPKMKNSKKSLRSGKPHKPDLSSRQSASKDRRVANILKDYDERYNRYLRSKHMEIKTQMGYTKDRMQLEYSKVIDRLDGINHMIQGMLK